MCTITTNEKGITSENVNKLTDYKNSTTHICLESHLVNFDIPKTLKTVLDSPKQALSNRTMGGPLSKNVPVTPLRYKFHDFLLLIY